jgi:hypothetical protein
MHAFAILAHKNLDQLARLVLSRRQAPAHFVQDAQEGRDKAKDSGGTDAGQGVGILYPL